MQLNNHPDLSWRPNLMAERREIGDKHRNRRRKHGSAGGDYGCLRHLVIGPSLDICGPDSWLPLTTALTTRLSLSDFGGCNLRYIQCNRSTDLLRTPFTPDLWLSCPNDLWLSCPHDLWLPCTQSQWWWPSWLPGQIQGRPLGLIKPDTWALSCFIAQQNT